MCTKCDNVDFSTNVDSDKWSVPHITKYNTKKSDITVERTIEMSIENDEFTKHTWYINKKKKRIKITNFMVKNNIVIDPCVKIYDTKGRCIREIHMSNGKYNYTIVGKNENYVKFTFDAKAFSDKEFYSNGNTRKTHNKSSLFVDRERVYNSIQMIYNKKGRLLNTITENKSDSLNNIEHVTFWNNGNRKHEREIYTSFDRNTNIVAEYYKTGIMRKKTVIDNYTKNKTIIEFNKKYQKISEVKIPI